MGGMKRVQRKSTYDQLDNSDADSVSSTSSAMSDLTLSQETEHVNSLDFTIEKNLEALYEKRGSTREKALSGLVEAFEGHILLTYVENKFITLLHQYINSIKRGSSKEACLASRAIGLLSITVGAGSSAHEIMEESIPQLSLALKPGSDTLKRSSVLDCLAIVTFVGASGHETEDSMKIMWDVIRPKSGSNVGPVSKPVSAVLASAISAWSFLLTTISGGRFDSNNWKELISFLSTLLEREDRSVRIAAGEAIALIFEIGTLDKISREEKETDGSQESSKPQGFLYVESLRGKILSQVKALSAEAKGKGTTKKDLTNQKDVFQDILEFLEDGYCRETSMKISKHGVLKVSTWTQLIQLNFLKRFLGSGFLKHLQENELLHDVFSFAVEGNKNLSEIDKKWSSKERTQVRNMHRMWAQNRKGRFGADAEDD